MKLIIEEMVNYDIIAFQELWYAQEDPRKINFIKAMHKKGFQYFATSLVNFSKDAENDGGMLIMSRFPIVESEFYKYSEKFTKRH